MKNVTVTLDPDVAHWARVRAAEEDMSMSRFLGRLLEREMKAEAQYETAMEHYLARKPTRLRADGRPYPTREELHERS